MSKTKTKRRLEFVQGSSKKFWEVEVVGNAIMVRFGRLGTTGQAEARTFAEAATAEKHAEKKIAEKLKKGYSEIA